MDQGNTLSATTARPMLRDDQISSEPDRFIPPSAKIDDVLPKAITATTRQVALLPVTAAVPQSRSLIRIPLAGAGLLSHSQSTLRFDLALGGSGVGAYLNGSAACVINRLRIVGAADEEIERIENYNLLSDILDKHLVSKGQASSIDAIMSGRSASEGVSQSAMIGGEGVKGALNANLLAKLSTDGGAKLAIPSDEGATKWYLGATIIPNRQGIYFFPGDIIQINSAALEGTAQYAPVYAIVENVSDRHNDFLAAGGDTALLQLEAAANGEMGTPADKTLLLWRTHRSAFAAEANFNAVIGITRIQTIHIIRSQAARYTGGGALVLCAENANAATPTYASGRTFHLQLYSSFLNSSTYIPIGNIRGQGIILELTLEETTNALTYASIVSNTTNPAVVDYGLSNIAYEATITVPADQFAMELATHMSQVPILAQSTLWRNFIYTGARGETQTIPMTERCRSLKGILWCVRDPTHIVLPEAYKFRRVGWGLMQEQIRVGADYYPVYPIRHTAPSDGLAAGGLRNLKMGSLKQVLKVFNRLASLDYSPSGISAETINDPYFVSGYDFESWGLDSGEFESGKNTAARAEVMELLLTYVATSNGAMRSRAYVGTYPALPAAGPATTTFTTVGGAHYMYYSDPYGGVYSHLCGVKGSGQSTISAAALTVAPASLEALGSNLRYDFFFQEDVVYQYNTDSTISVLV